MVIKLLLLAIVIFAIFMLFRGNSKRVANEKIASDQKAVEMKQDPICKTYVEPTTDYKVKLYDDIYYFCSDDCKQKFIDKKTKHS